MKPGAASPARATRGLATPIALGLDLLIVAALGALQVVPFVHTGLWFVQWLAPAWLAWRLAVLPPAHAAWLGEVFGTSWVGVGTWWLFVSLHTYGGLPSVLAVLAIAGLSAFLSLYLALAFAAFARWRSGRALPDALLFGAVWLLAELARGVIFTGFPWLASGYAQVDGPLAVLAPWIGVYGIGFVLAVLAAWPVFGGLAGRRAGALAGAVLAGTLLLCAVTGPMGFSRPNGSLRVTLLQSNVPQDEKFAVAQMPEALAWTADRLLASRADLVIGPETIIPLLPFQLDPAYWQAILDHFHQGPRAALFGLPLGDEVRGYTNSAAGISRDTAALPLGFYRYDKHHLVPFGEFVPFGFHWFVEMMNIPLGDFNRGPVGPRSFAFKGQRIGANICYEDLFGEELAARFADAADAPTMFANISNIGWFGDTAAIDEHLQISRMRTLEFQRPMLRATNTGATVVIDHAGRVTAALPRFTKAVLDADVEGRVGLTPFAWWAAHAGLWPPLLLALAIVASAARRARRSAR